MMKYERGRQKVDEALGDEAASFLKLVNTVLEQQHGEKFAAKSQEDTYRMIVKLNDIEQKLQQSPEGEDPELRFRVDKAFNTLIRQFRIALYSSQPPPEKNLQKAEVAALKIPFDEVSASLLAMVSGNMTKKNMDRMKELMDEISRPALLEKLLFDKSFEDIRAKMKALFEKIYQELLEGTGEIFEDTAERRRRNEKKNKGGAKITLDVPSEFGGGNNGGEEKTRCCVVASCGSEALFATIYFRGSPFCALHHFKAYPEFNQEGTVKLHDWLDKPNRRRTFIAFIERYDKELLDSVKLYDRVKTLNEEKDGSRRALIATNILNVLIETAGDQLPTSIRDKIKAMITENHAPSWIFDSILPRLCDKLSKAYQSAFVKTSAYKVFLQTARLPKNQLQDLAWKLSAESHKDKGMGIGFKFNAKATVKAAAGDRDDGEAEDAKRPRDIDTNAVLQPFAVEKDRSPTIRRFQPGDEEADMEALDLAYNSDEKEGGARQGQGGGGETGDLEGERGKNDDGNSEEDESKKKTEIEKNT